MVGGGQISTKPRPLFRFFVFDFLFCKWYLEILIGMLGMWGRGGEGSGMVGGATLNNFFFDQKPKMFVGTFNAD